MTKKHIILFLITIMALATFLRFWDIKSIPPGLYPDEAMNGNNALEALETKSFKIFYPENNGREGLFINIQAISLAVFGNEPWALRLISAIFGTLTVLGLYFLTKVLFKSEMIALIASFFMATSFWHINFSRIGFRAIMAPFFLIWSFYFLWKSFAKTEFFNSLSLPSLRSGARPHLELKNSVFASLSGLFFGLGFHTYIAYRIAPLLLIIPFILLWKAGQKKLIFIFFIFAFLASLPLGLYFLKNPQDFFGRTSQISIFSAASPVKELGVNAVKTIGMFFYRGDYNWRHNVSGSPELWWPIAILFFLEIGLTIKRAAARMKIVGVGARPSPAKGGTRAGISDFQTSRGEYYFLVSWFVIMLLPTIISSEGLPHALRAIVIIPPVMIFSALGLYWIISKITLWIKNKMLQCPQNINQLLRIKKELIVLLFLLFLATASHAFNQYFFRWARNPYVADAFSTHYVDLGNYLKTLPADIPKYVIVNTDGIDVPVKSAFQADNGASNNIPMPAQTTMFITKTFLPQWQQEKNIFYITLKNFGPFIQEAAQKEHLYISMLENDGNLRALLKQKIPGLRIDTSKGILVLYR